MHMYVSMDVCMYVCTCMCRLILLSTMQEILHVCVGIHGTEICMRKRALMYVCHTCIYDCTHVYYIYIHINIHMHTYAYIHDVYAHTCIRTHTQTRNTYLYMAEYLLWVLLHFLHHQFCLLSHIFQCSFILGLQLRRLCVRVCVCV